MTPIPPEMLNGVDAFEMVMAQYNGAIASIKPLALAYAKSTYNYLALFAIVIALLSHFLKSKIDATEALLDFVKTIVALYVVFFLIWSWDQWAPSVWLTFKNLGTDYATAIMHDADSKAKTIDCINKPSGLVKQAVDISSAIFSGVMKHLGIKTLALGIWALAASGVVLYCFARIATELIIVDIGGRLILFGGSFMLAFGATPWTRQYYEKFISAVFNVAIKMMFIRMLVGIGVLVSSQWVSWLQADTDAGGFFKIIVAIGVSTYVYYLFCLKLPDMAASLLSGSFSIGLSSGDANINTVMRGAGGAAQGIRNTATGAVSAGAHMNGMGLMLGAALDMANTMTTRTSTGKSGTDAFNNGAKFTGNTIAAVAKPIGQNIAKAWQDKVAGTGSAQVARRIKEDQTFQQEKKKAG